METIGLPLNAQNLHPIQLRRRAIYVHPQTTVVRAMGTMTAKYKGTQRREKSLTDMIEKKVMEAKKACEGDAASDECRVAWDEVEEVSEAKARLRFKLGLKQDPLESFCGQNPESDECSIYDDDEDGDK